MEKRNRNTPGGKVHSPETVIVPELEALCGTVPTPWSASDDAILSEYYPRGVPLKALSKHLGRSISGIRSRVVYLNLTRQPTTLKKE